MKQEHTHLQQQHALFSTQIKDEGFDCTQLGDSTREEEIKQKSSEIELQVDRLNAEKERLEQQNDEREVKFARLYNKFSAVANEYNDIAITSANPIIHQYIGEECIMLQFDHSQNNLDDFKLRLKPLLVKLSHQISNDHCKLEAQKIEMENELDKMKEKLSTKKNVELVRVKDKLTRLEKELESNMELAEKEYTSSMEELRQKEHLLDKKQKEITEALEEEKRQCTTKKKELEEIREWQVQEQNSEVDSLLKFGEKVMQHKKYVEDQIDMFNDMLHDMLHRTYCGDY